MPSLPLALVSTLPGPDLTPQLTGTASRPTLLPCSALHDSLFITHHGFIYKRTLVELSDSIKRQLGGPFLAAHLRIEEDADGGCKGGGGGGGGGGGAPAV